VGGDGYGITLGTDMFVRGATTAIGPYNDPIVVAACNNITPNPPRRRPQGVNGIILAFGRNQEGYDFANGGLPFEASVLNTDGFGGCVGGAICYPIATIPVDDYGFVNSATTGAFYGAHVIDGVAYPSYLPVYRALMTGHINLETDATYEDETAGLAIPNAAFQDPLSQAGDYIEIELSGLFFKVVSATGSGHGGIHVIVTEDYFGTPVVHTISQWFRSYVAESDLVFPIQAKIPFTLTRGGTLRVEIRLYNSSGGSTSTIWNWTSLNNWGTYSRYR